jgi:D-alanine-D-alanine ligase
MIVAILHNEVSDVASPDEQDVLAQRDAISEALRSLGHQPISIPCTLNLEAAREHLVQLRPAVVFNLVESLGGSDWLMHSATALLDVLGLPYTGSPTEVILATTHKLLAKKRLRDSGLPTPPWIELDHIAKPQVKKPLAPGTRYIIKSVWEHASVGLDDQSIVVAASDSAILQRLADHNAATGRVSFAEQYIEGREFNLSLLADSNDVEVLPPAEIDFSAFPSGKPHIVGYHAKWDADSAEYQNTPRRFEFPRSDGPLLGQLAELARASWQLFGVRGYSRVDFRVDAFGRPWILEVNTNPCLSPDAGFAAALSRAGINYPAAIDRVLQHAQTAAGV